MRKRLPLCAALWLLLAPAARSADRDILWRIVSNCLQDEDDYCRRCPSPLPARLGRCADASAWDEVQVCRQTTEVWAQTQDFVVIRDIKMCGCPKGFAHGLALPRHKVTGVEDPSKPAGLWPFAWDAAVKRFGAERKDALVLAVNPPGRRTQDQLHVHLMLLTEGARQRLMELKPLRVQELSEVWPAAARHAAARGLPKDGYAVAVSRAPEGGYLVATSAESLEKALGIYSCR